MRDANDYNHTSYTQTQEGQVSTVLENKIEIKSFKVILEVCVCVFGPNNASLVFTAFCCMLGMQTHTGVTSITGITNHYTLQPHCRCGNSLTMGCHGALPGRSVGWSRDVSGAGVYRFRIVSVVGSKKHMAQSLCDARGKSMRPITGPLRRHSRK